MLFLTPEWLQAQTIDMKQADQLRQIGEHKGRSELYGVHVLNAMESLRQVTAEHSAAAACRLERSETSIEQANYQRLMLEIPDAAMRLPVEPGTIVGFHEGLFQDSGRDSVGLCSTDAALALAELCQNYRAQEAGTEPVLLAGAFVFGLLRIRPFGAGNVRVALLVALWLLSRQEYAVGRFVSLERLMEAQKIDFQVLTKSLAGDSGNRAVPITDWWSLWLKVLLQSYRELSARATALGRRRGVKTDMVLAWIDSTPRDFSLREVQQQLPECGVELIRKVLKEQKSAGKISCLGRGPHALWRKKKNRKGGSV